jgi:predicted small lipoprotein YifL
MGRGAKTIMSTTRIMKLRILILSLVVPIVFALAGCGEKNPEGASVPADPTTGATMTKDAKSGSDIATAAPTATE